MSKKKNLRAAVIGIGNMGRAHAVNIFEGRVKQTDLVALCDISESKREWARRRFPGIAVFDSINSMLSGCEMDILVVAVPHYSHTECALKALERGINVMVEKPVAVSVSDAERMNEAADKSGKAFGIMFNQRIDPTFVKCREIVRNGVIGNIKRISWTVTNWYRTQSYYNSSSWRATWGGEGGGVLINQAPHNLDMLQWIFGMPSALEARCIEGKYHDIEVEDYAQIHMEYENGAIADFMTSTGEYPGTNRLEAAGDRGKLVLENGTLKVWTLGFSESEYTSTSERGTCTIKPEYTEYTFDQIKNAHARVLSVFSEHVWNANDPIADGREGIRELEISNAAYLSAWTGRTVTLPVDRVEFDRILEEKKKSSRYVEGSDKETLPSGEISSRWQVKW